MICLIYPRVMCANETPIAFVLANLNKSIFETIIGQRDLHASFHPLCERRYIECFIRMSSVDADTFQCYDQAWLDRDIFIFQYYFTKQSEKEECEK